jgi:Protein of unknown function (DUF4238)
MMPNRKQNRTRAMHRLAQFYLGRWADEDGGVRVLFRHDGRETITGTKAVAVGTDFYAIRQPDGTISSEVEDVLKTWDGCGANVIRKLLDGVFPLEEEDRMKLGLFLGLQWLRGRHARRVSEDAHDLLQKIVITAGLDQPPLATGETANENDDSIPVPSLVHLPDETKRILRDWKSYRFPLPQEHAIGQMIDATPEAASYFLDAEWQLVRFRGHPLLTSDEPIVLGRETDPAPFALGLENTDFMLFPLSPGCCLMMLTGRQRTGKERRVAGRPRLAREFNDLMVANSWWEQLYRHPAGPAFPVTPAPLPKQRVVLA